MFSMFKTSEKTYPSEDKWTLLKGTHEGKPMWVRRNDSALSLKGHADYGHRVGVAVPLVSCNEDGLPTEKEFETLDPLETAIAGALESKNDALQVLAITTNSMRELIFYTRIPAETEGRLNEVRSQFPQRQVQSYVARDKNWDVYEQFS
jgi:hypothetical protein